MGIAEYIARDKPEAARRWVQKIRDTCETLARHPETGELRRGLGVPGCRSFTVGNYVIFFRSTDAGIDVARIVRRRRPGRYAPSAGGRWRRSRR